jgi:hypothetical protein
LPPVARPLQDGSHGARRAIKLPLKEKQAADNALLAARGKLEAAEFELSRLQTAKAIMLKFQKQLRENLPGPASRARRLAAMSRAQEFLTSSRDVETASLGGQIWESLNRLRLLGQQIESGTSSVSAERWPLVLERFDSDAASAMDSFYALVVSVDPIIEKQTRAVNDLRSQIAAPWPTLPGPVIS